jgi:hypothetical protein
VDITNIRFDTVGEYKIVDGETFGYYASEGLFEFRVYTIGTFFKVSSPKKQVKIEPGRGIWIG